MDEDGLHFDADTIEAEPISEDADYEGVRVILVVYYLERAKIPIQTGCAFVGTNPGELFPDCLCSSSGRNLSGRQRRISQQPTP